MDVLGHEEYRLLGVLGPEERTLLNDMLRRVMVAAEAGDAPAPGTVDDPGPARAGASDAQRARVVELAHHQWTVSGPVAGIIVTWCRPRWSR